MNFIEQCSTELSACYRAVSKDHEYWRTIHLFITYYKLLKRLRGTTYPKLQYFIQKLPRLFLFQEGFCWDTFKAKSWIIKVVIWPKLDQSLCKDSLMLARDFLYLFLLANIPQSLYKVIQKVFSLWIRSKLLRSYSSQGCSKLVNKNKDCTAHWAFYHTRVHKKYKNLINAHFLHFTNNDNFF